MIKYQNTIFKENFMDFGMPTLIELNSIEENATLCKSLNLQFIELNMNLPLFSILSCTDKNNPELNSLLEKLISIKNKYGIYYTIHLDENFNFADFNSYINDSYLKTLNAVITNSQKLKCPIINMHLNKGVYFTLPQKKIYLFEKYNEHYTKCANNFLDFCEENLSNNSTTKICIENTDGWKDFEKHIIQTFLKKSYFGLTFDIGHSQAINNVDEEFIFMNKNKLLHFHIHDGTLPANNTYGKNHLTLGTGNINLQNRLELAKTNNCRCVIETKTIQSLKDSVEWLKNNTNFTKILCQS